MLHENRESVPFREVEPDTGFPIYAFFSLFRFWMATGCKSDWSIHYIWLQIKRLNAEIETLGANLTEVMQKENDTANQVSLCDNQTASTRKILMIGLAQDLNVGDRLIASDHGLTSYELALFLRCRIFQKVHQECPLKWRTANYPWSQWSRGISQEKAHVLSKRIISLDFLGGMSLYNRPAENRRATKIEFQNELKSLSD